MFSHAYLSGNLMLFNGMFVKIVMVKKSAKSQILNQRKMMRVTFVVTNMELEIVHSPLFQTPLKETAAGEGVTLFSWEATPNLAVFQNIIT
jgi:hypothetical protein